MEQIKWYMISTIRGKEDQVLESLNNRIQAENLLSDFDLDPTTDLLLKFLKNLHYLKKNSKKRMKD
ncbi:hypothetical protein ONA22_00840 [Mycoplasmopsis cynos]|nr:transcription termination/antitermination NusG family protein [Mycoplasmopsis cynos]WAM03608.1 hypothetical protein ONA22_00840 [Mycoplasmopsis cynos]